MAIVWTGARCDFINTDTASDGVHPDLLKQQIIDLQLGSADLLGLSAAGNDWSAEFDSVPDAGDKTSVEGVIAAHDHEVQAPEQILEFLDTRDPLDTDDETTGAVVNSIWINTITREEWLCLVNTKNNAIWKKRTALPQIFAYADQLLNPNNADWKVNALAPLSSDLNNDGLAVRLFDDTTELGVGFIKHVPLFAKDIRLMLKIRAETAPGGARTVGWKLYNRSILDNGAVSAWSSGTALDDADIPTNEYFQYHMVTVSLSTLGVVAGSSNQFELTRVDPQAGSELFCNCIMMCLAVEFL